MHPSLTATLVELEATDALLARSDYCSDPEVQDLPSVGSSLGPNLEAIAGLQPRLVLVDGSAGAKVDQLAGVAPIEVFPWLTLEEVVTSIRRLGELTGRAEAGNALADRFESRLGVPRPDGPRVLLAMSVERGGPVWFLRRNSLHGAALRAAGYQNAVEMDVAGPPTLSLERLIAIDPDAVVFVLPPGASAEDEAAAARQLDAIEPLTAPGRGQVHVLSGNWLGTGPEVLAFADALEALPIAPKAPTE